MNFHFLFAIGSGRKSVTFSFWRFLTVVMCVRANESGRERESDCSSKLQEYFCYVFLLKTYCYKAYLYIHSYVLPPGYNQLSGFVSF